MEKAKGKNKIISGALWLGIGAFLAKLLGAIYRVPLTNYLGATGLGLYQMVFPVYTVMLDFSGAGVPSALSKLISSNQEDKLHNAGAYLSASIKLFFWFGLAFSLIMLIFSRLISTLQGNNGAYLGYVFLSPAVLLVSLISCFRGYFQGLMNMKPTAISQVLEQVVKLGFGLILVIILMPKVEYAVAGATFAITLSEIVALAFLYLSFRKFKRRNNLRYNFDKRKLKALNKSIIKLTIPITIVGIFLPLSQVIDSFLVLNILGKYLENATSLYGLLSGVVATVIGLPVAICYGVATVAIPAVSRSKAKEEQKKSALRTLLLTLAVALPATLACYLFAPTIIMLLFRGLSVQERSVAISLLKLSSPCILLLSILQTANGILIGKGKPYLPVLSLGIGVTVKEILNIILLKVPKLNIYGSAIAIIACYFTVCLVNLIMIFAVKESRLKNESKRTLRRQYAG